MQIVPHLGFDGQCAAVFEFYEKCLGGVINMMMRHGESPIASEVPADWHSRILHAELTVGDQLLYGADAPPGRFDRQQGFAVTLNFPEPDEGRRVFDALSAGGTIQMPFEPTFWASGFGMVVDQFGTPWMINCNPAP